MWMSNPNRFLLLRTISVFLLPSVVKESKSFQLQEVTPRTHSLTSIDEFGRDDLVHLIAELDLEAQHQQKTELIPEIIHGFLEGALWKSPNDQSKNKESHDQSASWINGSLLPVLRPPQYYFVRSREDAEDSGQSARVDDGDEGHTWLDSEEDGSLPEDLSDLSEDIVDDITAGVEESLRLFDDVRTMSVNGSRDEVEMRQLPMYLFQGQYVPEPRLNRFIDGAFRNMGTEMRISSMDPLYFRVLPRGRVEQRVPGQGLYGGVKIGQANRKGIRRRRPGKTLRLTRQTHPEKVEEEVEPRAWFNLRNRKQQAKVKIRRQKRRRQRLKAVRRNNKRCIKTKRCQNNQALLKNKKKQQLLLQQRRRQKNKRQTNNKVRIRRRILQNVGGGRVEGLSNVQRDADAEMQLFGNYTLIRSHMKIGPVELTMQFRTKKGIRRTGATLPFILAHTVTRVNHEGSEMVDFLLDRPHPEMIKVRNNLFPKAQQIAKNIFSRLFLPDSFLVLRMREKTGLALLSRPTDTS